MALRQLSFEVVHHRQAFQSPYQNLLKSAVNDTLWPGRYAGGLGMVGLVRILRLMSIILYAFFLFCQTNVFVVCLYTSV